MRKLLRVAAAVALTLSALSSAHADPARARCRIQCFSSTPPLSSFVNVEGVTQADCCGGVINFSSFCPNPGSTSNAVGWNNKLCPLT